MLTSGLMLVIKSKSRISYKNQIGTVVVSLSMNDDNYLLLFYTNIL